MGLARITLLAAVSALAAATFAAGGSLVRNGDFERGKDGTPEGWRTSSPSSSTTIFSWEPNGGIVNSRCISIEAKDLNDAAWLCKLKLKPRTPYIMRAMMRGVGIEKGEQKVVGANIGAWGVYNCFSDPAKSDGTFDWTPVEIDFATGDNPDMEINCRLGHWYNVTKGKVYFDNVELVENPSYKRYESKHFTYLLDSADIQGIPEEHIQRQLSHLDAVYDAMAELVGHKPFKGAKIAFYASSWYPGGYMVAGNPIQWHKRYVKEFMQRVSKDDDWGFGHMHEIGHDFDEDGAWNFNGEFWANFKVYYAMEKLGGRADGYVGKGQTEYWKKQFDKTWANPDPAKRCFSHDGLQYMMILMKDKIGWEPIKKTFRWFHTLPADQRELTQWQAFKLFHDKLKDFSGYDVWTCYTPDQMKMLKEAIPDKR